MKKFLIEVLFLFFLVLISGCLSRPAAGNWILVVPKEVSGGRIFSCWGILQLEAGQPLRAAATGCLKKIIVTASGPVSAGRIVARLSNPEIEKNLIQVTQEEEELTKEVHLNRDLFEQGILQKNQLEPSQKKLGNLKKMKQIILGQLELTSEITGFLNWLEAASGDWVNQGDLLGYIFPEGKPEPEFFMVRVKVPEFRDVHLGQKFSLDSPVTGNLSGEIFFMAPFVKNKDQSAQREVWGRLKTAPKEYFVSLPVEVNFLAEDKKYLVVPRVALFKGTAGSYVYIRLNQGARQFSVQPLFEGDEEAFFAPDSEIKGKKIILNYEEKNVTGD